MLRALALILALGGAPIFSVASAEDVDLELVLAVDLSGSMDIEEARVQRSGYAEALRHPEFIKAVKNGYLGRIAIGYFEWAALVDETSVVAWQLIEKAEDADAFASRLEARPIGTRGGTSISSAILFGANLIETSGFSGTRRILDISGDGPNNSGPPVVTAREVAFERGITINGLAILIRPSVSAVPLDQYYADCVIVGPGSFVLPVHDAAEFAAAIRRKLVLEVSGIAPAATVRTAADASPTDCLLGERLQPGFVDRLYPELGR